MTRSIPATRRPALFCANLSALPSAAARAGPPETRLPSALVITARLGESSRLRAGPRALTESLATLALKALFALAARLECRPLGSFDLQPLAARLECGPLASFEPRSPTSGLKCGPRASIELWPLAA